VSPHWHRRQEEARRSEFAEFFTHALHRDQRHPEGAGDLGLGSAAIGHELTGKEAKGGKVAHSVREDREVPVEVIDMPIALLKS